MAEFEVKVEGIGRLINRLKKSVRQGVIEESLKLSGIFLESWSKENRLSGPRPRFLGVKSDRLRPSVSSSRPEKSGDSYSIRVGTNVVYGRTHEYGRGNIPARPFLSPAIKEKGNQIHIVNIITRKINEALKAK